MERIKNKEDIKKLKESMEEEETFWWYEDRIDEWFNSLKKNN